MRPLKPVSSGDDDEENHDDNDDNNELDSFHLGVVVVLVIGCM